MAMMAEPGQHKTGDRVLYVDDDGRHCYGTVASVRRVYTVVPEGTVGITDQVDEAPW